MAEDAKQTATPEAAPQTPEQLMADLQLALTNGDFKQVSAVSRKIDNITKAAEKVELEAKRAAVAKMEDKVKAAITKAVKPLVDSGDLDAADGIWFSYDFGEAAPTVRLVKTTARAPQAGGGGTGKKFDVSTDSLLAKYGSEAYKDSGMTVQQAYESNTDKNYRYAIRQHLLKKDGII